MLEEICFTLTDTSWGAMAMEEPDRRDHESGEPLAPKVQATEDIWPLQGIIAEHVSDGLRDQTRLSILSWTAGLKTGKVTNRVVALVIPLQEAQSQFHEIAEIAAEQFHISQGADQLIMFHKSTFELGEREDRRTDLGHVKAGLGWPAVPGGQIDAQEGA